MARISFNRNEVEKVVELANKHKVKILLVKDEGIYIMACFEKTKEISYAKGCNPKIDEDWYSKSYVVSNNDLFEKILYSQKNHLGLQTKVMDVPQLIQDACFD